MKVLSKLFRRVIIKFYLNINKKTCHFESITFICMPMSLVMHDHKKEHEMYIFLNYVAANNIQYCIYGWQRIYCLLPWGKDYKNNVNENTFCCCLFMKCGKM